MGGRWGEGWREVGVVLVRRSRVTLAAAIQVCVCVCVVCSGDLQRSGPLLCCLVGAAAA